ncbi:nuclease-related domain-containing protein [Neobacillus niacini]|uniref:nuclease-related domain-containing protein n=1 Tax=Neobacillus niacini TaxID=86668 RepID=UPI0039835D12
MIAKPCVLPKSIEKYQAIIRRIPETNLSKPEIVTDYNNRLTGFLGEESVMNFHLEPISDLNYQIYHDLRLYHGKYYFQIDILILCAYFALVLEVKNWSRDWHFDKVLHQTMVDVNGKLERTKNPIFQARLQAFKLREWLKANKMTGIPIQFLFVNSNEKSNIIIQEDNKYKWNVCNSEYLLEKIDQIDKDYKIELLDEKELRKINKLLLTSHTPENVDLLEKYNLSHKEILTGVHCPGCNHLPMTYNAGTWRCSKCRMESKTAFTDTIQDYFHLINPTITNSEARRFLQIKSPKMAHYYLNSMNLNSTGTFKNKI